MITTTVRLSPLLFPAIFEYLHYPIQEVMTFTNGVYSASSLNRQATLDIDFRFLGPRMIYTSGIVLDLQTEESLEQLQDNKLTVVCEKVLIHPQGATNHC